MAGLSLIGVFFAYPSLAATQTYSTSISSSRFSENLGGSQGSYNFLEPFSLPTFDSSLGTLTGVRYLIRQTESLALGFMLFDGFNSDPFTVTAKVGGGLYFVRGDYTNGIIESFQNVIEGDVTVSIVPGTSSGVGYLSPQPVLSVIETPWQNPEWLGEFVTNGQGSLTFGALSFTELEYSDYVNGWAVAASGFDADIAIEYSYVPTVPEPETYAILLAGLGLLGLTARRRRQKLNT